MRYVIPTSPIGYPEGSEQPPIEASEVIYYPREGEMVHVLLWERYPDYDFIFGVPSKDSPRYEKEIAFFQFRRVGDTVHYGHYFDVLESEAMARGFARILEVSKKHSPHLYANTNV